ncbi:MAG: tRNA preQ1(34) S-adenosylmethionine ribosyltransferase-isomerase QueA [Pseudomonadota bacterium]
MRTDLFDFQLPDDLIALRPVHPRDAARLLVVQPGEAEPLTDKYMADLPLLLEPGDAVVFNDTRVIPAALRGERTRNDATVEVSATLIEKIDERRWLALAKPGKRLEPGDRIRFAADTEAIEAFPLEAIIETKGEDGQLTLVFDLAGDVLHDAIESFGSMPLPPYIAGRRAPDQQDRTDYQTTYAREEGAVAAPTAGLHFTPRLIETLDQLGVMTQFVTLHVGAGTFLPVRADDTKDHRMHAEYGEVSTETAFALNAVKSRGNKIIAIGTTSLRLLESASDEFGTLKPFRGQTDIFITPGYRFQFVDRLLTNFHLPRSTLFMLVSAFSGLDTMKQAYAHAIAQGYRFYSYGDACLLSQEVTIPELSIPETFTQESSI